VGLYGAIFLPCATKFRSKFWIVGLYGVIFHPCATKFVANFGLWVCMV
jgi:hypothetical protein